MKKRGGWKSWNIYATLLVTVVIVALFVAAFLEINASIKERAIGRMEEGVNTVIQEVTSKFERDSRVLNATADIISTVNNFDVENTIEMMKTVSPLLETMLIRLLLPDDRILVVSTESSDTARLDALSFEKEAALGEHVSDRVYSSSNSMPVLRHFVPVMQDGEIAALLYGITLLEDLPKTLNIENIYNASASVYIVDTKTGDFLLDTYHNELGNIRDFEARETNGETTWEEYTDNLLSLKTGYVVFKTHKTGGWEYLYYAPAGINEWAIAVSVPEREAFSSVYAVRKIFMVIGVIMIVALAAYYVFIYYRARRAIDEIVERAVLEEKLKKAEAAERAKSTFLSNMSHDIRTPMNAIIGFTVLADANIDNKPRVQEYLSKILSSSNHLLSLINDVLDMSRIESGKLNIDEKPCSISDIFRDMRNIIQTQMQSKQLNFFMDTMDVVDEKIYCDKLHINQVLLNLLSNAIKFTPPGGSVSLTVQQKPGAPRGYGSYEIRVKDTGIGMDEEFVQHIFEPFERERNTTVSGIQGTGLGMAITKNIVDTMGGSISVNTERGKGTEFIINFTFRLQNDVEESLHIKELMGVRGLVVDDNFTTCDSVTKMLTQIGMRAEWSMHGQEAVLRARQAVEMGDAFYAYIIDWALPDLSGLEVVRQIRSLAGDTVPIIILTAYDWTTIEDDARMAGVTAFCNKPLFLSELRDTLMTALGKTDLPDIKRQVVDPLEDIRGSRLLLVEDNELNREIAQELLEENGFKVETACDGSVAVDMVRASAPGYYSLVLMDVQMPVMDGYEASRAIRALENPELAAVPIIAMTANAFSEDRQKALDSGMNAHVAKPINLDNLIQTMVKYLEKKKTDD